MSSFDSMSGRLAQMSLKGCLGKKEECPKKTRFMYPYGLQNDQSVLTHPCVPEVSSHMTASAARTACGIGTCGIVCNKDQMCKNGHAFTG